MTLQLVLSLPFEMPLRGHPPWFTARCALDSPWCEMVHGLTDLERSESSGVSVRTRTPDIVTGTASTRTGKTSHFMQPDSAFQVRIIIVHGSPATAS